MSGYNHEMTLNGALTALQNRDFKAAKEYAQLATDNRPDDAESWSVLGMTLDDETGLANLRKAVDMEPREPRWYLHLGNGLSSRGDFQAAQPAFARACELSRGHPEAMKAWGNCLLSLQKYNEAANVFQRVLQAQPSSEIWIKAGDALLGAKDTINAAKAYEHAHTREQRPIEMSAKLADLHLMLNHYDQAETFIKDMLDFNPKDPDGGLRLANLMRWRGDHTEALRIQQLFWQTSPTHAGLIAAILDDGDEAVLNAAHTAAEDEGADISERRRVSFSLARYYDKQKSEDLAWQYAVFANSLYDDGLSYDGGTAHRSQLASAIKAYKELPNPVLGDSKMIYVMGPPRCGGSLLQTILAQSKGVTSVGERGALLSWFIPNLGDTTAIKDIVSQLAGPDLAGMAQASGRAEIYVDKTSPHIIVAGLLAKIHAGARFVLPVRDHADMIVSMYFHDFPSEFVYTRTVQGIADYLAFQDDAAKAWRKVGLEIVDHDHDKFVQDPVKYGQALFEELDLPWSDQVLETGSSDNVVRTFSARQVRGGVSKKYTGRGERYAEFL